MKKPPKNPAPKDNPVAETVSASLALCTCFKLRRATRRATQIYDRHLEPAGLRITQFGLLAQIQAADRLSMGELAERMGMDSSTLTRNLKPLESQGLVRVAADTADRRVRDVSLTPKGRDVFRRAAPKWREAQTQIDALLGFETRVALNGLLDLSVARLAE
jgi:DNA-binding MarR family transcriptional regulator